MNEAALGSMTRGYVGDTQFAVLPDIQASHTMVLTLIAQLVKRKKKTSRRGWQMSKTNKQINLWIEK